MIDYKCIGLWGQELGSYSNYIAQEKARARLDNAPADAIYKNGDNWVTLGEVRNRALRIRLTTKLAELAK